MAVANFARRVLVVDDEPIIRTLLADRLADYGFETFVAADALSAKRVMLKEDPDALVVDLDLGEGPSGSELISALSALNPHLGFVLLTNYTPTASELKAASRLRYLNKRDVSEVDQLVAALEAVLSEASPGSNVAPPAGRLSVLTKGQIEVLGLVAKGLSNVDIAQKRGVGIRAVEQTIHRVYLALGLNRSEGSARVVAARIYNSEMGLRRGS